MNKFIFTYFILASRVRDRYLTLLPQLWDHA